MAKKTRYESQRNKENYTFHPGRRFELSWPPSDGDRCFLVALDEDAISMLLKMLAVFPKYHWVWGLPSPQGEWDAATEAKWEYIQTFVERVEACLTMGCDVSLLLGEVKILRAAIAGEEVTVDDELGQPVQYDYTENGLVPMLNDALHVDRTLYPDLNISQILMKGLIGRQIEFPLPFDGDGAADIFDELITRLDGRFRQTDLTLPPSFEKNITETFESLLRDQGSIFDPEFKPNIANIVQRSFNVSDDSPMWDGIAKLINEWAYKLGIPGGIHDDNPRSIAEILLVISQLIKDGNVAVSKQEMQTIINILNQCGCDCEGECTCGNGPSITVEDDNPAQVEGGDNLIECGCVE